MKKILVLGANGFSGKNFIKYWENRHLIKEYRLIGVDLIGDQNISYKSINLNLLQKDNIEKLLRSEKPDYIVNLIGNFQNKSFEELFLINVAISKNILETIEKYSLKVKKLLLIGSAAEYGITNQLPLLENSELKPISNYGLTKAIQTQVALFYYNRYHICVNIARTFNIIGSGLSTDLSIGNFISQLTKAKDGDIIHVGNLQAKRDFLAIEDVIDAYWKILLNGEPGEIYNVCSGKAISIEEMFDLIKLASGKKIKIEKTADLIKDIDIIEVYGSSKKIAVELEWKQQLDIRDYVKTLLHNM